MEIKQDKKAKEELKAQVESGEKVVIGEPITEEIEKAMTLEKAEDEVRTRILRVKYKASQAKLMAKFFKENNIDFEFIKADF